MVRTYTAQIYVGLRLGYDGDVQDVDVARGIIQAYVNTMKLAVTLTSTEFIYVDGREPGIIVGLINYPRFPSTPDKIRELALELARLLQRRLGQMRVSIVFPDETVMLEAE